MNLGGCYQKRAVVNGAVAVLHVFHIEEILLFFEGGRVFKCVVKSFKISQQIFTPTSLELQMQSL